ncbi:thiamine phosphate synthase [Belliella kenyensis]|uniref:Thiamine-phosphate synthase n=1 Tax=Belliella kenyensis TaxID=1472724 RepID=A0ABV8EPN0_9BACT|nr:thiamine phosphate synthase [Belliella kenyensis]MCH7403395.1 thiamine phosphate synthase [Belliella kenyensis]MDN3601607.1 thiamine phosphate synthase [Belliella kenyensis]
MIATKKISQLQYISQVNPFKTHQEAIENALLGGCKWIQLRVKDLPEEEILNIAKDAKAMCMVHEAVLIINDHVKIAKAVDAEGVHLGLEDMGVSEARKLLGADKIIGATANTIEQISQHAHHAPDYIGLGPFRFTVTKKKLSPVLGLESYQKTIQDLKNLDINIPIIAVGGIKSTDVEDLIKAGVYGVAISSDINQAEKPKLKIEEIEKSIQKCSK